MADPTELFKSLPRKLKLEVRDPATSDDPLMAHLQRCGWDLEVVREVQDSVSKKLTPDLFTGEIEKLDYQEYLLQQHIEAFWTVQRGMRK